MYEFNPFNTLVWAAVVVILGTLFIGALNQASMTHCLARTSYETCHKALN